jgi:hypothetical protein
MSVALELMMRLAGELTSAGDGGIARLAISEGSSVNLDNGTGLNQANAIYIDDFNIAASGSQNYDVSGTLTDRLGNLLVFTAIKAIMLISDPTNVNSVIYGNVTNGFVGPLSAATVSVTVPPGGFMLLSNPSAAGWPVTAATADLLKLANSGAGTAVTGTIVVVGEA